MEQSPDLDAYPDRFVRTGQAGQASGIIYQQIPLTS